MARIDATAAKAAAALAAAQLTTILQDDTLTELFNDYKQAHHPMRGIEEIFLLARQIPQFLLFLRDVQINLIQNILLTERDIPLIDRTNLHILSL